MYFERIMWSNQGITCHRSSGDGTRLYQKSQPPQSRASAASHALRPPERSEAPLRALPDLRGFTAHLHSPRRAEQLLDLVRPARNEDADQIVAVPWVVGDAPLAHHRAEERHGRDRAESAEQNGQLERDHDVRRN